MTTLYTIQANANSGETYALRYDDDTITHISGPLYYAVAQSLTEGHGDITNLPYDPISEFFYDPEAIKWQQPTFMHTVIDEEQS